MDASTAPAAGPVTLANADRLVGAAPTAGPGGSICMPTGYAYIGESSASMKSTRLAAPAAESHWNASVPPLLADEMIGMNGTSLAKSSRLNHSRVSSTLVLPGPPAFRPPTSGPWSATAQTEFWQTYPSTA